MSIVVVDRRSEPSEDKFGVSRKRFIDRNRAVVKAAVNDRVANGSIKDFEKGGVKVPIPPETLREPTIHHDEGGDIRRVFPGLAKFDVGDRIPKPQGGGKGLGKGDPSEDGEGTDDFLWISPEEFLEILFDGRQLPDMTKFKDYDMSVVEREHAGYTNKGPSHKMDMEITNRKRVGESLVLGKLGEKRVIGNLVEQFNILADYQDGLSPLELDGSKDEKLEIAASTLDTLKRIFGISTQDHTEREDTNIPSLLIETVDILKERTYAKISDPDILERLEILEERLPEQMKTRDRAANFRPDHLTYKYDDDTPKPAAKAVLFCKMDVSGSMDQERKNTAKSFFWLINKFLTTKYDKVEIVFIAHTTEAEEVDEETFFYGQESGGTIVSTCLEKSKQIITDRYPPSEWNIYGVQASDGENPKSDNPKVVNLMKELLPLFQSYYYIQVAEPDSRFYDPLLPIYKKIAEEFPKKLFTALVNNPSEALEAFRYLFPVGGHQNSHPMSYSPA